MNKAALEYFNYLKTHQFKEDNFIVKFDDLLNILAYLHKVERKSINYEITTDVEFYGRKNMEQMLAWLDDVLYDRLAERHTVTLNISGEKFNYSLKFPLDLEEIQADGELLKDHARIVWLDDTKFDCYYSKIIIDKKVNDLLFTITPRQLITKDNKNNYPMATLKDAVFNCNLIFNNSLHELTK